jgi:hypothetical protein
MTGRRGKNNSEIEGKLEWTDGKFNFAFFVRLLLIFPPSYLGVVDVLPLLFVLDCFNGSESLSKSFARLSSVWKMIYFPSTKPRKLSFLKIAA